MYVCMYVCMYVYCITPSRRLRAGARQRRVSGRNAFKNKKFPHDLLVGVDLKDDKPDYYQVFFSITRIYSICTKQVNDM